MLKGFPGGTSGKTHTHTHTHIHTYQCRRDMGSILYREDPLEERMATHSSVLAWRILRFPRGAWKATVHKAAKSQT